MDRVHGKHLFVTAFVSSGNQIIKKTFLAETRRKNERNEHSHAKGRRNQRERKEYSHAKARRNKESFKKRVFSKVSGISSVRILTIAACRYGGSSLSRRFKRGRYHEAEAGGETFHRLADGYSEFSFPASLRVIASRFFK